MPACADCKNFIENQKCSISGTTIDLELALMPHIPCSNYKVTTAKFIEYTIQNEISGTEWENRMPMKTIILNKLKELNPDVPKDGSVGKISFDVPNKARMKIKTQRFLTRKLNLNDGYLPDHIISSIANKINSKLFPEIKIELIKGKAITEAYRKSVGGRSCMTGSCCDFTRLYEMNPDKVQMLTMHYMNDSARAILYKLDDNKGYYLDRVYCSCSLLHDKMYAHADNNGWYSYTNLKDKTYEEKENLIISNLEYENGYMPYMDTFNGTLHGRKLTLSKDGDICMDSTCGYLVGRRNTCERCGERIHENNAVSIGDYNYCEYCAREYFTYCEHCNEYVPNDDAVLVEDIDIYVCEHCASNHYVHCEDCGIYTKEDYVVVEGKYYVCISCSEGTLYKSCKECSEWFYEENINEDGYCESCEAQRTSVSDCKPEDESENEENVNIKCESVEGTA